MMSRFKLLHSFLIKIPTNTWKLQPFVISVLSYRYCTSLVRYITPQEVFPPICNENPLKSTFDVIMDTRTPDEFKQDHLPYAVNIPVLSNEERKDVGKLYSQEELNGRKLGAQLILKNIASHLADNEIFSSLDHNQRKLLIYCWRGNQRSRALATVLSELTKSPVWVLTGGYRGFREFILRESEELLQKFELKVISGLTGSGKTALLESLEANGHHVLHLERLAKHRGSLLGRYCEDQPSQKAFDCQIWQSLRRSASRITSSGSSPLMWVECESRVVGSRHLREFLWTRMSKANRVLLQASKEERIKHILKEYKHLTDSQSDLLQSLDFFGKHHPVTKVNFWKALVQSGKFEELVRHLLDNHYDPAYTESRKKYFYCDNVKMVTPLALDCLDDEYMKTEAINRLMRLVNDVTIEEPRVIHTKHV